MYIQYTESMNIKLSQQVSATYARNHFKEVIEKATKEGVCIIVKKSKPVVSILSMPEYEKTINKAEIFHKTKVAKKITLKELRKNSRFEKFSGCFKDLYPKKTSVELAKEWYKYVD